MDLPVDTQFQQLLVDREWDKARKVVRGLFKLMSKGTDSDPTSPINHPIRVANSAAQHPIVYLPVEIKAREFAAKCKLAKQLSELGLDVVIGACWPMQTKRYTDWPPGIILFKTLNRLDAANMAQANKSGHIVTVLDEEAFSRPTSKDAVVNHATWSVNTEPDAVEYADTIYCQGWPTASQYAELGIDAGKLIVRGNPRSSIIEAVPVDNSPANISLICGMSGTINGQRGFYTTIVGTIRQMFTDDRRGSGIAQFEQQCLREIEVMEAIRNKIESEAQYADRTVIFRPHPAEGVGLWGRILPPNVVLDSSGSVPDHLATARRIFHVEECGVGLEGHLMGLDARMEPIGGDNPWWEFQDIFVTNRSVAKDIAEHMKAAYITEDIHADLHRMYLNRRSDFNFSPFHLRKFPLTPKKECAILLGMDESRVMELETNLWYIRAE